jgi:Domain of unknown function (DUF4338)/Transposase Tn5 dimerisation domain/Transposase DNA-binding
MVIGGRVLEPELLEELKGQAQSCSRRRLAALLCERADWRSPSGGLALMSARKVLAQLTQAGQLPPPTFAAPPRRKISPTSAVQFQPIVCTLQDIGPVEILLLPAGASSLSRQWNQLLEQFHYLGAGPLCGAQLRYLVGCPQGWLAALAFSAAAWQVAGRDRWIGWSNGARRENLHRVVNNSRWLILPQVQVPNLASHILGRVLQILPQDWQGRYGYTPVLVETFVEQGRFQGTSYQAANWQAIAVTQGRGRQDAKHLRQRPPKILWVYPLQKDFRQVLQPLPQSRRLAPLPPKPPPPPPPPPADWAQAEFAQAQLGDQRLVQRCCQLGRAFYARPQAPLPQACGSRANTKAAYRFFDNPRVTMPGILQSHYQASLQRVASEPLVLAVQDTTSLNYSAHPATEMLGLIGSQAEGPIGMLVHSTLAFNLAGTPLGLLDVQSWTREPEDFGKKHQRKELPFEAKESVRWLRSLEALERVQGQCPNTRLVGVGDREADIYELFVWATEKPGRPSLLVRAERERVLAEGQEPLWAHVSSQPVAGELDIKVPRRGNRPGRIARLSVRFAVVELRPPLLKKELGPVKLWAVLAREQAPPADIEPLEWALLTSLPVPDFPAAEEKLRWYAGRWGIEVFHRVLKSGCQIEQRQLAGADRLEACLAIDLVVAWRIFHLTKLGRETPEVPCTVFFEEHEWKALVAYVTQSPQVLKEPPKLREAVRMVASLGGFLGRKADGEPGTQTLWLGLQRLDDLAAMYLVMCRPASKVSPVSSDREYG